MSMRVGSFVLLASLLAGCATSRSTTGLANAPKLGTSSSRARLPYDVVADGRDSCEREPTEVPRVGTRAPPCAAPAAPAAPIVSPPSPPARPWIPRSRWSIPPCASADANVTGLPPLESKWVDPIARTCPP